jgi:hypothetical protein
MVSNPRDLPKLHLTPNQTAPIIYMIRHGEKPPKLPNGDDADGLSAQGLERAQGLRQVFSKSSSYNIGYILAEHPKKGRSLPPWTLSLSLRSVKWIS